MFKYHTKTMEMYYDKVVEMHLQGCSIIAIHKKFGLDKCTIRRWIRNFAEENNPHTMPKKTTQKAGPEPVACNSDTNDVSELKAKIRQLESQLKDEKLRADVYDMLITIAEEDFKIPIRKKDGAKQ